MGGDTLSNGYQLQHYHPCGNSMTDPIAQKAETLRTMSKSHFMLEVARCQQLLADPCRQWAMQQVKKGMGYRGMHSSLGMPEQPDYTALVATGNRDFAVMMLEQYLRQYVAWKERLDPDGRKHERELELTDRRFSEEKRKRREKREKQGYTVM